MNDAAQMTECFRRLVRMWRKLRDQMWLSVF